MASWSRQRRLKYATIIIVVIAGAVGVPAFFLFYKAPSCSDGIKNGDEQGVDCGGSCEKLCPTAFLAPSVSWVRFKEVSPGLYNMAAYVINPNRNAEATGTPYLMSLLNDQGIPLVEVNDVMTIPPGRNTLVFQGAENAGKQRPVRAFFQFTAPPQWFVRSDPLSALSISNKNYNEASSSSSLLVTISNGSVNPVNSVVVYAVLLDENGNVLDFSKTAVDLVPPKGTAVAPFTWPIGHGGAVVSIEVLLMAK
jgi:hypothetical protein